jgi:hypothetical protein
MECLDETANLQVLRRANACLDRFLERISSGPELSSNEELRALLQLHEVLESVGALLDGPLQSAIDSDVYEALGRYCQNLIQLRHDLSSLLGSARTSGPSTDLRRQRLYRAKAWYSTSHLVN